MTMKPKSRFHPMPSLSAADDNGMLLHQEELQNPLANTLFTLTFATSLVLGMESFLNPKMLWQLFRMRACQLEAMMWHYRTRTGSFMIFRHPGRTSPESELDCALTQWRRSLLVTAESVGSRFFPARALAERDTAGEDPPADSSKVDENREELASQEPEVGEAVKKKGRATRRSMVPKKYSILRDPMSRSHSSLAVLIGIESIDEAPVTGDQYLCYRLYASMRLYKERLPSYRRMHTFFRMLLICLTLASTLISYMGLDRWLVVVVALSGYVLTWTQTKDFKAKADPRLRL